MKYLFFIFSLMFLISCNNSFQEIKGEVFGSTYLIKYYGEEDHSEAIDSIFTAINNSISTYQEDSEISIWNKGNDSIEVSYYFSEIYKDAKFVYELSDGAFDPTVKPLVDGWGFGNGEPNSTLNQKQIDSLLQCVGFSKTQLSGSRIKKSNSNIQLDFNSIAPGFTADKISDFLSSKGIKDFLVDIGGEIYAKGKNKKNNWVVGIDNPIKSVEEREVYQKKKLYNQGFAVSGNYRKVRLDSLGNKIVHTINPKTGYTQSSNLLSITIVCNNASLADAFATFGMSVGVEKMKVFLQNHNKIQAMLISENNNELKVEKLNGF